MNVKISISVDAKAALESMLSKANTGFKEGRISKQNLASWLILFHEKIGFEKSIPKIRAANLDPILVLKAKIEEIRASRKSTD